MRRLRDVVDTMDLMFGRAASRGVMYRNAEDESFDGRTVRFDGRDLVHFGSCSYLGLELHPVVKAGGIDAIQRYGAQFSASRAAASVPLYAELEDVLGTIMGMPVLLAPSTSLAHSAALPLLVDERDAVILDQQVHTSVVTATNHVLVQGTHVEVVRHGRLDLLEARIRALRQTHHRIWYMADGVYSMFGDLAPMRELSDLLDRYPCLHLYLDDAHGMSWTGKHGRGHVLEQLPFHERLITATSLAKAFGVGGGVLVVPDEELRRRLRTVGQSFTFSGPLQPPVLGAALASARLHLSGELEGLQARLQGHIALWNNLCRQYAVPLVSLSNVPIRFIACGRQEVAYGLMERMMEEGFYPTLSVFPAVPMKRSGVRFALNLHQTEEDLRRAVETIARHLPLELARVGSSMEEVYETFELEPPTTFEAVVLVPRASALTLEHHDTIAGIDPEEWDRLLGGAGTFTWEGMRFLEDAFRDNPEPANNWRFHYYFLRESSGHPVLATFFTETWLKDDMLAPAEVSQDIERRREQEPGFLTSRALMMGSMLTEGQHLYLDRERDWRGALALLLDAVEQEQARCGITSLVLRDLPAEDMELDEFFLARGFARFAMPESLVLDLGWEDEASYMARLSAKSRLHQRKKVLPFEEFYDIEVLDHRSRKPPAEELAHYHALYEAVAHRNLDFNCFPLPSRLIEEMLRHPRWELLLLHLKPEHGGDPGAWPVAFMASFRGPGQYVPMFCGLDYRYVKTHGTYRQLVRKTIIRARSQGFTRIFYGFGATHEKTRFGCKIRSQNLYMQTVDAYQMEVLAQLMKVGGGRA